VTAVVMGHRDRLFADPSAGVVARSEATIQGP
jgi:hypothetical protein